MRDFRETFHGAAKVRIIGGGLTGLLAAFEAHRLGCRDITLHEHFGQLGGSLLPRIVHGLELRESLLHFGPRGDAMRALLEAHGVEFEDFEDHRGSVSAAPCGDLVFTRDFDGPALRTRDVTLKPVAGSSLTDRLRAYPDEIGKALARHCQWTLGTWLDEVDAGATTALGIDRILPLAASPAPLDTDFYAVPGRTEASLPRMGLAAMFAKCRRELEAMGVVVHEASLVSPRQVLTERQPGETVVWAADPMPLFACVGMEAPKPVRKSFATYLFKAKFDAATPFHLRNFTATGSVSQLYLYESRGQALLLAQCIAECGEDELRREISRLMAGFDGAGLEIGEQVAANVGPGRTFPSVDSVRKLKALRASLARTLGGRVVIAAWEPSRAEAFAAMSADLAAALDVTAAKAA